MSELKILSHLGQHKNIVNLLGACTHSGKIPSFTLTVFWPYELESHFSRSHDEALTMETLCIFSLFQVQCWWSLSTVVMVTFWTSCVTKLKTSWTLLCQFTTFRSRWQIIRTCLLSGRSFEGLFNQNHLKRENVLNTQNISRKMFFNKIINVWFDFIVTVTVGFQAPALIIIWTWDPQYPHLQTHLRVSQQTTCSFLLGKWWTLYVSSS